MPLSPIDVRGLSATLLEGALPHPAAGPGGSGTDSGDAQVAVRVAEIIDRVRKHGDSALLELTTELDGVEFPTLTVPVDEVRQARRELDADLLASLELAWDRLLAYHRHQGGPGPEPFDDGVVSIRELVRPVRRAGLYTPGGKALYPSSVLMCAAPAKVAGVAELVLC